MTESELKKYKSPMIEISMPSNWMVDVRDYHEFDYLLDYYKKILRDVHYEELGLNNYGSYEALFWVGEKPTEFIEAMRKNYDEDDD